MIAGLQGFVEEQQLYEPTDLKNATIGIAAESLASLSTAELTARLQSRDAKFVVVFDGPGRTTKAKLDDGICRRKILSVVIECKIPFVVAPALAAAQLAYMYTQQFISHAYGCEEVLLFGDVPLVSNLFGNGIETPVVLRRPAVCAALKISESLFYEVAVAAGSSVAVSHPLAHESSFDNVSTAAETAVFSGQGSFYKAAMSLLPPQYVSELQKALVYVVRQPILLTDGSVALSNKFNQVVPRDIVDVVGRELPPECYFYLNKGLLGNEYLKAAVFGEFVDYYQPEVADFSIDAELNSALTAAEEGLQKLRAQTYSLLSSSLHRYFQNKEVTSKTPGGANFTRSSPLFPELTTEPVTPQSLVKDSVNYVRKILNLTSEEVANKQLPEFYAANVLNIKNSSPVIAQKCQLAFREALEVAICWFMFNEKVDRFMDTNEIISSIPW